MDFVTGNLKKIYFKYLAAAFGSALVVSIYSIVDMAMVGQYQGPEGTAALAVFNPIWNVIYSLGLLMGIGGSVLLSNARGKSQQGAHEGNQFFSLAVWGSVVFSLLIWLGLFFFEKPILTLFGANESLYLLASSYLSPIRFVAPIFMWNQMLAAFLRNDNNPQLATLGVLSGGVLNIVGDYVFVFLFNWGIFGAGVATSLGAILTFLILISHFFRKQSCLRLVACQNALRKFRDIVVTGFSTFFVDIAMGILTILFNTQILKYLGEDALAIYAVIITISTLVQACAYSIGQAAQPLISVNYGAGQGSRVKQVASYALYVAFAFGIIWTALSWLFPTFFISVFMTPTASILAMAPAILGVYGLSFLLLPFNIFATYYFQALMKPGFSLLLSVLRGALVSGGLILALPLLLGANSIWWAMPLTELLVALLALMGIVTINRQLLKK